MACGVAGMSATVAGGCVTATVTAGAAMAAAGAVGASAEDSHQECEEECRTAGRIFHDGLLVILRLLLMRADFQVH